MIDFDALVATASLPTDEVPICLDGDLVHAWEAARDRVEALGDDDGKDTRIGAPSPGTAEREELAGLTEQVEAKNQPWKLRGMPEDAFVEFCARPEFAARKLPDGSVDPRDARLGMNNQTFVPGLVAVSLVDPDVSVEGRWEILRPLLTRGQVVRLFSAAWSLNSEDRDLPFSRTGSLKAGNSATG